MMTEDHRRFHPRALALTAVLFAALAVPAARGDETDYDAPPIEYSRSKPTDPVAKLRERIERGEATLDHDPTTGYLAATLRELKIPVSSQVMVFSKTSQQRTNISPERPRAIYFDDNTYVGYVPDGDILEIASADPKLGMSFYTINQGDSDRGGRLRRQTFGCLQCHGGAMTRNVPGLIVRSVFPDDRGNALLAAGTFNTTHKSPLGERWGGWYVTGSTGGQPHMGNTFFSVRDGGSEAQPIGGSPPQQSDALPDRVDRSVYPSPHSDVVALMVFEHQAEAHNRMSRAAFAVQRALHDEKVLDDAMGETRATGRHSESTRRRIRSGCEPLVEHLLFAGEAPLAAPVTGSSSFAQDFAARGPRDEQGRSLRDFDLKSRMFRHPLSYLIYSDTFNALPELAKTTIYARLDEILSGTDASKTFAHLSADDRRAVAEILRATKKDLPADWGTLAAAGAGE